MSQAEQAPAGVDVSRPTPARLYDYYLGGTNNFAADRAAAEKLRERMPELEDTAWANRGFHQRAARWMADQGGIRQFIDIGSGLPTQNNTHHTVRKIISDPFQVVYVDSDPMVLAQSGELLDGADDARVVLSDLRDPDGTLGNAQLREMIDFTRPIGLILTAVLHFVSDESDPWGLVRRYLDALPSGSYLALSHVTADKQPPGPVQALREIYSAATENVYLRTKAETERFFDGLELIAPFEGAEPGVAFAGEWGAEDPQAADSDGSRWLHCGVARIP